MFQLSPATLAAYREQAESAFKDTVTFYDVSVTRDVYGNETYNSGVVASYPCLIGGITGKDEEIVARLITDGAIRTHTAKCLVPWDAVISTEYVAVVSGGNEWYVVWNNTDSTDDYRLYTKAILTRETKQTEYKDRIKRNS